MHTFPSCLLGDPLNTDRLVQKCRHPFAVLYAVSRSFGSPSTFTALFILTYLQCYALSFSLPCRFISPRYTLLKYYLPASLKRLLLLLLLLLPRGDVMQDFHTHTVIGWLKKLFTIISKRSRHGLFMSLVTLHAVCGLLHCL